MKDPTLFDFLNQIYFKTNKYEYSKKIAPSYMLTLWLSHDIKLIDIVHKLCYLQFLLPDEIIYNYYFNKISKGRRYIKWIKKTEQDKIKDKKIKEYKETYKISKKEAKMLIGYEKEK